MVVMAFLMLPPPPQSHPHSHSQSHSLQPKRCNYNNLVRFPVCCRGSPISSNLLHSLPLLLPPLTAHAFLFPLSLSPPFPRIRVLFSLSQILQNAFFFFLLLLILCLWALLCSESVTSHKQPSFLSTHHPLPSPVPISSLGLPNMSSWRKQYGEGYHHWSRSSSSSSSHYRKPPLEIWRPTVPRWEKMFCAMVGLPWEKLVETKKYLYLHDNVMNWDDSAGREAFDNAKRRFWSSINGLPCDIPLPDPDIYIDDIDWNSSVDPELVLDLERDETVPSEEEKEEVVILGDFLLLDQSFSCTGWGESEEADTPKHSDSVSGAQANLHENNSKNPWEQYHAPYDDAKDYEWQNYRNDTWGWNPRQHYHSYTHRRGRGAGWNRRTWYGDNRKEENISWYKAPAYHHGDEYHTNRGRRWGNFA